MLFHVYIGTAYQAPVRAPSAWQAAVQYATEQKSNPFMYHAKPATSVQGLKACKRQKVQA